MQYRKGAVRLGTAAEELQSRKDEISFVLNLGDIIDGNEDAEKTAKDLDCVLESVQQLRESLNVYHVIGNHCLRVPHASLLKKLEMEQIYYSRTIREGWKLIVLNSNDLGMHAEGLQQQQETQAFLEQYPIDSLPCVQRWNGGVASVQLEWLRSELRSAKDAKQKVIIGCHHPFGKSSARETHMAWNASQMEAAVIESDVVTLVMSGHDHAGGYSQIHNTHFLTLQGIVEAEDSDVPFAFVHVTEDEIIIEGRDSVPSRHLALNNTHL